MNADPHVLAALGLPPAHPTAAFVVPLTMVGSTARRLLADGTRARVAAVFQRSFYLEEGHGNLLCVGCRRIGNGPLNAICDPPMGMDWVVGALRPGAEARVGAGILRVGRRLSFSVSPARDWRPETVPSRWTAATLAGGLATLAAFARDGLPAAGLGGLIARLAADDGDRARCRETALERAAKTAAAGLRHWLVARFRGLPGDDPPPRQAARLIGLGPGLTPSGDDFIGGMMIVLRSLGEISAAQGVADWALPVARARTGKVSLAHLACAANGEGAAALHETLAALFVGDVPGLRAGLAAVGGIGHSSGWDALAGAVCAADAWARVRLGVEAERRGWIQ